MSRRTHTPNSWQFLLWTVTSTALLWCATGCYPVLLPSQRFQEQRGMLAAAAPAAVAQEAIADKMPLADRTLADRTLADRTLADRTLADRTRATVPPPAEPSADQVLCDERAVEVEADPCPTGFCPSVLVLPRFCLPHWMGPLFHRGVDRSLVEAELKPPHSRFHPVPTHPVFEPLAEYSPPQLMMEEVRHRVGHGPGRIVPDPQAQPLAPLPPDHGTQPPPAPLQDAPSTNAKEPAYPPSSTP